VNETTTGTSAANPVAARPHYLLVTILGVVAGFALAAALNTQLAGMAVLEIVGVVAVATALVVTGYRLVRRRHLMR